MLDELPFGFRFVCSNQGSGSPFLVKPILVNMLHKSVCVTALKFVTKVQKTNCFNFPLRNKEPTQFPCFVVARPSKDHLCCREEAKFTANGLKIRNFIVMSTLCLNAFENVTCCLKELCNTFCATLP